MALPLAAIINHLESKYVAHCLLSSYNMKKKQCPLLTVKQQIFSFMLAETQR